MNEIFTAAAAATVTLNPAFFMMVKRITEVIAFPSATSTFLFSETMKENEMK